MAIAFAALRVVWRAWYSVLSTQYSVLRSTALLAKTLAAFFVLAAALTHAQDEPQPRLMDQVPFDILTLDKANDSKVYKVYPVRLPGRRVPEKPKPNEKVRVKLIEDEQEYDVQWSHIAKLELYEQMVAAEVQKFASEGKLDDAYDELAFLLTYYPNTPGLAEVRQNYLYLSSAAAFRQQKYDEALAILEELIAHNPNYRAGESSPTVRERLADIADRLIGEYMQKEDYRSARALLARLAKQYKTENDPFAKKWRGQLEQMAARQRDEAKADLAAGRFIEAHDACSLMLAIWPELPGASDLAADIARRHPLIRVGVEHPALAFDVTSLDDVAARRAGRLRERLLVEHTALGPEGGKYESPLGLLSRSDDRLSLLFRLQSSAEISAYDLAQRLLARATEGTPEYDVSWSR